VASVTGVSVADELPGPDGRGPLSGDNAGTGRLGDKAFAAAAKGSGALVIGLVTLVGLFLLWQAIPAIADDKVNFLTSRQWAVSDSDNLRFGIVELLWTTVAASTIAMLIAVPVGVAVALFITQYSPRWLSRPAASIIDLLAAVPSIVYGLWGLKTFTPWFNPFQTWLSDHFGWIPLFDKTDTQGTILLIGVVLSIMILPIVTALSREVFAQTPVTHMEGALALGATKWEMIRVSVLPFGRPGVISAAMLALGRALGETIAVTIIVSTLPQGAAWTWSLLNGGETFASRIANNAGEFDSPAKTGAFIAAGLVLFVLTFVVNAIARIVIERRKAFTE
jgi:phosphate transport system permease protein